MISALLLALEGLVLLILGVDLSRDFEILPPHARVALSVLAVLGALALVTAPARRDRRAARLRVPILVLVAGVLLVGAAGEAQRTLAQRIAARWDGGARARLEARGQIVREDVSWFLEELLRPIARARLPAPLDPAGAFDILASALARSRLPHDRLGFALYGPDGSLLAWDGNSEPAPRDLLAAAGPSPSYRIGRDEASRRLYAVLATPDRLRLVGEFLLRPVSAGRHPDDARLPLEFLPRWDRAGPAHVHLREEGGEADDLSGFFGRQGDRYWGRAGREGATTLSFPLRAPDGSSLAVVTLKDRRADQEISAWRRASRRCGALALATALLAAGALVAGGLGPGRGRLVAGTVGLWAARWALLASGSAADLPHLSIFDIGLYASPALNGLLRSPADLFLTALASLTQALLIRQNLGALAPPQEGRRRHRLGSAALAVFVVLAVGGVLALHRHIERMVLDARLDISRVGFGAHAAPRFLLQASLFFLAAALVVLLLSLLDLAARCRGTEGAWRLAGWRRGQAPLALRVAAAVLLPTLLYVPLLYQAYDRLRQTFFEEELLPRVLHQKERRLQILRDSIALASEEEFVAAAGFAAEEGGGPGSVAYRLWTETPMADMGLASSLQIYEAGGRLLDRFAVDLAPSLEVPFETALRAASGAPIENPPRPRAIVRKSVIAASRLLRAPRRASLLVVMTVVDDYDNLPLVGADTGYVQMFRARALPRTNPEILRFDPMVAVFDAHLDRVYESGGEIPPPGPRAMRALEHGGIAWANEVAGEGPARILYARGPGTIFALAHPRAGPAEILAACLRLVLLNGVLAGLIAAVALRPLRGSPRAPSGRTFYGRLTAIFLMTALVPLLALAIFVTRFSAREFARDVTTAGLGSLQVARRVAEDYLTVSSPEEAPALDDDVVFWLSRVVRQDLSIYRGAGLLATSTRELYSSGLLNTRLDGEVYRALELDREPFREARAPAAGPDDLTLSAPMRIDREATTGVISIPLTGQRRAIARKVQEVEDAVLISTCLAVLLLAGVAYRVARRVSEPISLLARAARRVAEGDLDVQVAAPARDEIAVLLEAFNRMAGSLREQREDLRRRKDYIEKILKSATTGVVSIDASGSIITVNPAAEQLLAGPAGPPAVGESLADRLGRDPSLAPLQAALLKALEGRSEREAEVVLEKEDREMRLRAVFIPFAPGEGAPPGTIVLLEDVTQIVRSGRLAAWAEMARRIAHEIKNPLTPIQLSVEHVRRVWRAGDPRFGDVLSECLDNVQRQVRELRQIASEFSAYARLPELRPEPTPVGAILEDALGPYLAAPPAGLEVRRDLPDGLPDVLADRAVIARALVNVIENALHAMPDGGTLSVGAAALDGSPGEGPRVRIEVRDTGHGIDPAIIPRLFEPYFSTRSGGTGLGLAIVRRAVEDHRGTIEISSRPGEGTLVALILPAVPPGGAPEPS